MHSWILTALESGLVSLVVAIILILFLPFLGLGGAFSTKEIIILVIASILTVIIDRAINLRGK